MSVCTVQLALDCAALSESGFFNRFADEFGKVMQAYPPIEQESVAKQLIDLFRRHGRSVLGIVSDTIKKHSNDIASKTLPQSSLLALMLASNIASFSISKISPAKKLLGSAERAPADHSKHTDQVIIAIDEEASRIHVWGLGVLSGEAIFPILERLIALRAADRSAQRLSKNFDCLSAKHLANDLKLSTDEAVRAAVRRARKAFAENVKDLAGEAADPNALIQTTDTGYRLNPAVEVVSLEEFRDL